MHQNFFRAMLFPLLLVVASFVAYLGVQPPSLRAPNPSGPDFDLGLALTDLRAISRAPHVTGSPENVRVRDYLITRLQAVGVTPQLQNGFGVRQGTRGRRGIAVAPVSNIVALLPGRDRSQPAVLIMAHYDSVPFSPGAADDGAGTVALLETARILTQGPQPQRDVIFLITDGEEMGLTGAQLFFDRHPLARRVGIVVNAEARGSRGRAGMFQTSPGSAALVELWADNAISPTGTSLSSAIYRMLPNDTDLSVSLEKGVAGINAAFTDGYFDYHSTTDSFATLDRATLQHIGDFAVTTTRALAMAEALPAQDRDSVYFDVFGLGVVQYPVWLGWLPLGLAALALGLAIRREPVAAARLIAGTLAVAALTVALALVAHFLIEALTPAGLTGFRERQAESEASLAVLVALIAGGIMLARPRRTMAIGAVILLIIAGVAMQIALPAGGFIFGWPALAGAIIALSVNAAARERPGLAAMLAIGMPVLIAVLMLVQQFYVTVGTMTAGVVAQAVPFVIALLAPALAHWSDGVAARRLGGATIVVALVAAGALAFTSGFSPRQPRPGDLFALTDARDGKRYWATTSGAAQLPGRNARSLAIEPFRPDGFAVLPVPDSTSWPTPCLTIATSSNGDRRRLRVTSDRPSRMLWLSMRPADGTGDFSVNGKRVEITSGEWKQVNWLAEAPVDITIDYRATRSAGVELRWIHGEVGAPASLPATGGPPTNWARLSGGRVTYGTWPLAQDAPVLCPQEL